MSVVLKLTQQIASQIELVNRNYFVTPSAGRPNGLGSTTLLAAVSHSPLVPTGEDDLTINATVNTTNGSVSPVTL